MSWPSTRTLLAPLALLVLPVAVYLVVLGGLVPAALDAEVLLAVLAGGTTVFAAANGATAPALAAGVATLGFVLAFAGSGFVVTVGAALTILGGVGFVVGSVDHLRRRAGEATPA